MIVTEGLTRRFGEVAAVEDLSLEVTRGEVLGVLGPNGAGKTTTVRMLAGLIRPTSGRASVAGFDVATEGARVRPRIGLLAEVPGLWESLSARQNLEIHGRLQGVAGVAGRVERYLRLLELWERRDEPAGSFSKGMKQKLALARALVHEPPVLFLDEPTAGLDPQMARRVRDFLVGLKSEGRTILLCTHNLAEAEHLCDRIAVLRSRLLAVDRPAALRASLFGRRTVVRLRRVDGVAVDAIRSLGGVAGVEAAGDRLFVDLDDPSRHTPAVVRTLVERGAEVLSVGESEPSLEDVYLRLVGEEGER